LHPEPATNRRLEAMARAQERLESPSKGIRRLVTIGKGSEIMVTKGQRRLGRTIRKLENSVELSSKETKAKESEKKYKEKAHTALECNDDSPVQSLRKHTQNKPNN